MCEHVRARLGSLSLQLQSSDDSESATLVSEFANLVLQDDTLWQLCPKATEELLCRREDKHVRNSSRVPTWMFQLQRKACPTFLDSGTIVAKNAPEDVSVPARKQAICKAPLSPIYPKSN